eukprot:2556037-Amphidinium_carterae.1
MQVPLPNFGFGSIWVSETRDDPEPNRRVHGPVLPPTSRLDALPPGRMFRIWRVASPPGGMLRLRAEGMTVYEVM